MKKYLCGRKALEYWGKMDVCDILGLDNKEEYVIFSESDFNRLPGDHWCRLTVAERYTENGVCTLPYLFLRYANELSLLKLIFLGMEICGIRDELKPLCTERKIKSCAYSLKRHHGRNNALKAVQFIQSRSYSPMESRLYMHLCLPNYLGGCGFPKAQLNYPITVGSKPYYLDLCFPEAKLAVEYDSYTYHSNAHSFSRDNIRSSKIETLGYRVIHVKPGQLKKVDAYTDLVLNISRILQKPVYIRTDQFFEPFKELFCFFKPLAYEDIYLSDIPQFGGVSQAYQRYISERWPSQIATSYWRRY